MSGEGHAGGSATVIARSARPWWWAALALLAGIALALLAGRWQGARNAGQIGLHFDERVVAAQAALAERLQRYQFGLRGARGAALTVGLDDLDEKSFHRYGQSRDIATEFPGARGFGIARRVARADEAEFVAAARRLGQPEFAIRDFAPHHGDRFVIQYIEPKPINIAGRGLDIASEPNRRTAAIEAARAGVATLTRPIGLVLASGAREPGFLLLLPIYRPGADLSTPEARERASSGWSYAPLSIGEVLGGLHFGEAEADFALSLSDRDDPELGHAFYASPGATEPAAAGTVRHVAIPMYGRVWEAEFRARPPFVASLNLPDPHSVTLGGIGLALLLSMLFYLVARNRQRTAQLSEEKDRRAAIVDASTDAIVGVTMEGLITSWNPAAEHVFGYTLAEACGQPLAMLDLAEGAHTGDTDLMSAIAAGRSRKSFEAVRRRRDGSAVDVSISASPVRDGKGRTVAAALTIHDVSEQKAAHERLRELSAGLERKVAERTAGLQRAEQDLERAAALLRTVLESATEVAIVAVGTDGRVNLFNSGAERLLGYHRDEVIGKLSALAFVGHDELSARARALSAETGRVVRTGLALIDPASLGRPHPWNYIRKDGSRVPVSLSVTAMHNAQGECFGYLGVAHDVTRQVQYEASLREAVRIAEHANLAKSRFLANMSHEIRTPMNAVMGLSYLLGHTRLDDEQNDLLDKIRLASKSLLGVIDDILDLSKIEAGELRVAPAPFSLPGLLHDLSRVMRVQADAKQIGFAVESPPGLPAVLVGDALRINQILTNLLSNAIKFTLEGGVRLVTRELERGEHGVLLRFEVHDSGIGIAPEHAERLFEPFAQADTSTTRRFGGTGLGLSIVRQLAQMMGGRVGIESVAGHGSEFWVELPLATADACLLPAATPRERAKNAPGLPGVRVLVVDDSSVNLEVARRVLELEGAIVGLAENGQVAVDRLRAGPGDFDVVLMDVQMPVLDGHAATRAIRGELGLAGLPVIALTAGALTSQHDEAIAAGMDGFIGKPFEPHEVVARIRALLPGIDAPAPGIEGVDSAAAHRRLGGDAAFLASLLGLLLEEFSPERVDAAAADGTGLAAAMHKLKGSAGNVGAMALHEAAAAAESAAHGGDAARIEPALEAVRRELRRLRTSANEARIAEAPPVPAAEAAAPLLPADLAGLLELLKRQDVAAIDRLHAMASGLRPMLGDARWSALVAHADRLRFQEAAVALAEAVAQAA